MELITVNVSVRDLVHFSIPCEGLRGSYVGVAKEGIEGHQIMHCLLEQLSAPAGTYQKELPVTFPFSHKNYTLTVSGRLDGLVEIDGGYSLCEIKTTEKSLHLIEKDDYPAYWAQGRCYAYIVAREKGLEKINVLLVYFHRSTKEYRILEETSTLSELEKSFHSLVIPYINGLQKQHEWQVIRNQSIRLLSFPYSEFRKGQRRMSAAVYRAIRDGYKQFVQAPTGIGKTIGSLFPAIKAIGEGLLDKVFYLTARNTTQAIALQACEQMTEKGLRLKILHITAKEKVCLSPDTPCTPDECSYLSDYPRKSKKVLSRLFKENDFFGRDFIDCTAKKHGLCPFELSLDLSLQCDLILCDYNYAFDPRVYLKRFFQDKPEEKICLLVDEAHNLPDRAREMYSAQVEYFRLKNIYCQLKESLPDLASSLKKICKTFLQYIKQFPRPTPNTPKPWFWDSPEPPVSLIKALENFLYRAEDFLLDETPYPFKEDFIALFFDLLHFTKIYDCFSNNYITLLIREKKNFTVRLFCIDPAPMLKKRMDNAKSTIFFSATLSPSAYFKDVLAGCEKDRYLILPSPFPRNNLYLYIQDTLSVKYRFREKAVPSLIHLIHECIRVKSGNYIVFFPSFAYMQRVAREYHVNFPDDYLLIQEMNMNTGQRNAFLENFTTYGENTLVAFAVMGGIFGEGIDLKGERLSGVIIVGVGLPQICPERNIIKKYYQNKNGSGFNFAYTYPGLNKVQQAAGRVIRSEYDRGVIILIDSRFTTPLYQKILPSEWFPIITPKEQKNPVDGLNAFWNAENQEK